MPKCSTEAIQKVIRKNGKAACCLLLAILHIKSSLPSLFPFFWRFSAQSIHQFAALSWTLQMPQMKHLFHLLCTTRFISFQFNSPLPPLKRRAFFVGACVLKESHQHSPGLRPRFSSGSTMDLRLKRKKTLKMHICAYQTRRHFLLVRKD